MKYNTRYCYYVVAFIDVLGQKAEFKDIYEIPTDKESEEKLLNAHRETVLFLGKFRDSFEKVFKIYVKNKSPKVKVPKNKIKKFLQIRKVVLKHHRFSDCIQAFVPLETKKFHSNAVNGVFGILSACGGMMLITLSSQKAFRAGIDLGLGAELNNGEVYGPALFKAYKLEDKIARYPRIVVGDSLINYLERISRRQKQCDGQDIEDIEACKKMSDFCLNMISKDTDEQMILNYLGKEFMKKVLSKMDMFKEIYEKAYNFVESEFIRRKNIGDSKLTDRYNKLYNYFKNNKIDISWSGQHWS